MLPYNVTVSEVGAGQMEVAIINPLAMMTVVEHPDLPAIAEEAKAILSKTLDLLNN